MVAALDEAKARLTSQVTVPSEKVLPMTVDQLAVTVLEAVAEVVPPVTQRYTRPLPTVGTTSWPTA